MEEHEENLLKIESTLQGTGICFIILESKNSLKEIVLEHGIVAVNSFY